MTVRKQRETQNLYTGSTDALSFPLTRDLSHTLGDGRGETFLSQGFAKDAAVAYSLRALGSYNEPVVRVRRDVGETSDPEEDFTASQVSGGELENWVNGKLESTLPADVATAAAAYSLRKVKASYSGDAVRIRRSSDSIEVNVAFDSDDKVSSSSAITNTTEQGGESGSTTATTLGDFLTEDINIFTDSSSQSWANIRSTDSFETSTALGGEVNYRKFIPNSGVGTSCLLGIFSFFDVSASSTYTISGQVYVPSGQTTVNSFKIVNGTSGSSPSLSGATNTVPATDQWVDFSFTSAIPTATQLYINAAKDQNAFFSPNGSDFIAFKDITVTATDSGATVHTWYDQAGSNDAVQETAANQPKIAENGALLADANGKPELNFTNPSTATASGKFMEFTKINFGSTMSFFSKLFVRSPSGGDNGRHFSEDGGAGSTKSIIIIDDNQYNFYSGDSNVISGSGLHNANNLQTFLLKNENKLNIFVNSVANSNNEITLSNTISDFELGRIGASAPSGNSFEVDMDLSELILYSSDQSDNRFKIESNINNYYGLYNDANDLEGTEFTGTSGTYTNNSKDGVTFVGTQTQSFVGIELKESVPVGETVYISFNCSHNAYSESTLVGLRASTVTGANASTSYTIPQYGFSVASLTSTDANAKFVTFQIRQDSPTFTVSDFKVSRIARNGVVETLYDQSGNGNNATQSSATKQPYIIQNGGQCKMTNGNPAVMGARYDSNSIQFLEMDTGISDPYTMFSSMYTTRSFSLLFGGNNVGGSPRIVLNTNGIETLLNATDDFGLTSTDNTIDSVVTLFSAENGGTAVLRKNGTQIDSLARVDDEVRPMKFLFRHQNNNENKGVFFDSFIVYSSDKTSDFTEIENNLKLANNIS